LKHVPAICQVPDECSDNNNQESAIRRKQRSVVIHSFLSTRGTQWSAPGKLRKAHHMNKFTSLLAATIISSVVGLGFATGSNAQSPMSDQDYCHLLVEKYNIGGHDNGLKFGRSEVGNATAVAIAQCLEGEPGPAIPVLEQKLREADIPVPARG
jgi:hypothetical protein